VRDDYDDVSCGLCVAYHSLGGRAARAVEHCVHDAADPKGGPGGDEVHKQVGASKSTASVNGAC